MGRETTLTRGSGTQPAEAEPGGRSGTDLAVAGALAVVAVVVYGISAHADWQFDPLKYAESMQHGTYRALYLQHALGTLVPLVAFHAMRAAGYDGGAVPVLVTISVMAAAAAVGVSFLAARILGASRGAAAAAAGTLGATIAFWRAGGSGGVYGVSFLTVALAWLAAARYLHRPSVGRASALGAAAGVAVAGHLSTLAFVVPAVVLVALATNGPSGRARRVWALAVLFVLTAGGLFIVTAGLATGFSPSAMFHWLTHPRVAQPGDRSFAVGWGIQGLPDGIAAGGTGSWLPLGLSSARVWVRLALIGAALGWTAVRASRLLQAPGRDRLVAGALLAHAVLSFVAASWYQALRAEYFALGFIPLALLAAVGAPRRTGDPAAGRRWTASVVAVVLIGALLTWNLESQVRPELAESRQRAAVAQRIEAAVPPGARILASLDLAGVLAVDGYRASSGWVALSQAVARGAAMPGLSAVLAGAGPSIFVSSGAFDLIPPQAAYLGATGPELWADVTACCSPRPVLRFVTAAGPETLYRLITGTGTP